MKRNLSSSTLKCIALIIMFLDHIGTIFISGKVNSIEKFSSTIVIIGVILRLIGRVSFTLYSYLLIEGYLHTKSKLKYLIRLCVLALISEVPFDLFFYGSISDFHHQNTVFTLAVGLLAIMLVDRFKTLENNRYLFQITAILFLSIISEMLNLDYGFFGIIFICTLYLFRDNQKKQFIISSIPLFFCGVAQIFGILGYIPISKYNGSKGLNAKYLFYLFYPFHLLLLYYIKINYIYCLVTKLLV